MSQPYIGEIRIFAGNFAPAGWMFCEGQYLPISENETLFVVIGTTYGGDGQSTFALPDLRGRLPVHFGTGYNLGEMAGVEQVTLTTSQMPGHSHWAVASSDPANWTDPSGKVWSATTSARPYATPGTATSMAANAVSPSGGNQPHENMPPFLCVSFIISLFGLFPSQT